MVYYFLDEKQHKQSFESIYYRLIIPSYHLALFISRHLIIFKPILNYPTPQEQLRIMVPLKLILKLKFNMKRILPLLLFFVFSATPALAQVVTNSDRAEMAQVIRVIVKSINAGDPEDITAAISEKAESGLSESITESLAAGPIEFSIATDDLTLNKDGIYTVTATFSSKQDNKELSGLSIYFDFENVDGSWWLIDTNFHEKLAASPASVFIETNRLLIIGGAVVLLIILLVLFFKYKKRDDEEEDESE